MALIQGDISNKYRNKLMKEWFDHYNESTFFDLNTGKPISRIQAIRNRIKWKCGEVMDGLRIIFKGEYPRD